MATARYQIQPTGESSVSIELLRTGLRRRKHILFFQHYQGDLTYDPDVPEQTNFTIRVSVGSMVCRDSWLKPPARQAVVSSFNDLLKSEDCPYLELRSQALESSGRHRASVTGALTVHGTTAPAQLEATIVPVGNDKLELNLAGTFGLTSYDVKPPKAWWGGPSINDVARVRFLLWPAKSAKIDDQRVAIPHANGSYQKHT